MSPAAKMNGPLERKIWNDSGRAGGGVAADNKELIEDTKSYEVDTK